MSRGQASAGCEERAAPMGGSSPLMPSPDPSGPQGHRAAHSLQEDVVLRVALWVLMGGTAAESILASEPERPVA